MDNFAGWYLGYGFVTSDGRAMKAGVLNSSHFLYSHRLTVHLGLPFDDSFAFIIQSLSDCIRFQHACNPSAQGIHSAAFCQPSDIMPKWNVEPKASSNRIYIGFMPESVNMCDLYEYFSNFGNVKEIRLMKECQVPGRALVVFSDLSSADSVLRFQPHTINETQISVADTWNALCACTGVSHSRISECNKADHSITLTQTKMPSKAASKLTSNMLSIYVCNLAPDATETDLIDYFSEFGHVKGARVVIDSFTGQCLGYGFVTFADGGAIKNGVLYVRPFLNGRPLSVLPGPPTGDSPASTEQSHNQEKEDAPDTTVKERSNFNVTFSKQTIFVGQLNQETMEADLEAYFSKFGTVRRAKIITDRDTGWPRGFGFVTFADAGTMNDGVLEACHFLHGRRLNVSPSMLRSDYLSRRTQHQVQSARRGVSNPNKMRKVPPHTAAKGNNDAVDITSGNQTILVGQLKRGTTKADLKAYFSKFGTVRRAKIISDRNTGVSRGFGFVTFADAGTMNDGVLEVCHFLNGCRLDVNPATHRRDFRSRRTQRSKNGVTQKLAPNRIYIEALPQAVTESDLHEYFSKFGLVKDVGLVERFKPLDRGFIVFRDLESATKVIESQPHKLNKRQITVSRTEEPRSTDAGSGKELRQIVDPNKIYLGSLPKSINECGLHEYFSTFGIVMDVGVLRERNFDGCGFVSFLDSDSPIRVLESEPHQINETPITVSIDRKPGSAGIGSPNSRTSRQNPPTDTHAVDLESDTLLHSESPAVSPEGETSGPAPEVRDNCSQVFASVDQNSGAGDEAEMQ
ncbi:hypothetical protein SprV_0200952900 [Sparganum proliferum]